MASTYTVFADITEGAFFDESAFSAALTGSATLNLNESPNIRPAALAIYNAEGFDTFLDIHKISLYSIHSERATATSRPQQFSVMRVTAMTGKSDIEVLKLDSTFADFPATIETHQTVFSSTGDEKIRSINFIAVPPPSLTTVLVGISRFQRILGWDQGSDLQPITINPGEGIYLKADDQNMLDTPVEVRMELRIGTDEYSVGETCVASTGHTMYGVCGFFNGSAQPVNILKISISPIFYPGLQGGLTTYRPPVVSAASMNTTFTNELVIVPIDGLYNGQEVNVISNDSANPAFDTSKYLVCKRTKVSIRGYKEGAEASLPIFRRIIPDPVPRNNLNARMSLLSANKQLVLGTDNGSSKIRLRPGEGIALIFNKFSRVGHVDAMITMSVTSAQTPVLTSRPIARAFA